MMPLPSFELARPSRLEEATRLLVDAGNDARLVAGGTDLLVNLKQGIARARLLVSTDRLDELRGVSIDDAGRLVLGASEPLASVATNPVVRSHAPALAEATSRVAHPQARQMGTLGGNVCLDVRCRYVNRTSFWRGALGGCLKCDGTQCHVVPRGKNCVAALCGDTIAPLVALGAEAHVVSQSGERWISIDKLRGKDGRAPTTLVRGEILRTVRVPPAPASRRSAYLKWAVRGAIDFPLVSAAIVCDVSGEKKIERLRIAVSALGPKPRDVSGLESFAGETLTPKLAGEIASRVTKQCVPLANVLYDPEHRRRRLGVMVRRQLEAFALTPTASRR